MEYCKICKLNIDNKGHKYTKKHKKSIEYYIDKQSKVQNLLIFKEYKKFRVFLNDPVCIKDGSQQPEYYCYFCEKQIYIKYNYDTPQIVWYCYI